MTGIDDQPDDEGPGPGPGPDSGPDDGPTPDDADPPVPDDDGEPEPDDEGDPPDDARPGRRRERRRTLELVTVALTAVGVALTAVALIVGSVLSYLSVVASKESALASRDSVAVAREALNDSRESEKDALLKDLRRITYNFRRSGDQASIEVENRSSRPFGLVGLVYTRYISLNASEVINAPESVKFYLTFDGIDKLEPCTRLVVNFDSNQNREIVDFEEDFGGRHYIVGTDILSSRGYAIEASIPPVIFEGDLGWNVPYLLGSSTVSHIDSC